MEEEIVIQQFDANVGVQPPLEGEQETPRIPCIACLEGEAVIVILLCGHCCFCLNCARLFEERGNRNCPVCRARVLCLFRIYY